jgi:hypothetical protein
MKVAGLPSFLVVRELLCASVEGATATIVAWETDTRPGHRPSNNTQKQSTPPSHRQLGIGRDLIGHSSVSSPFFHVQFLMQESFLSHNKVS